jgi:hypothetical protein
MEHAKFENCSIQMNEGNGIQNNTTPLASIYEDVKLICSELEIVAAENNEVRDTVQKIKTEIEKGASRKKIDSLLGVLKNLISVATIALKFPQIIEKVKPMIEKIID